MMKLKTAILLLFGGLLIGLVLYQCVHSGSRYLSKPTFLLSEFRDQKDALMPRLTYCLHDFKRVCLIFAITLKVLETIILVLSFLE